MWLRFHYPLYICMLNAKGHSNALLADLSGKADASDELLDCKLSTQCFDKIVAKNYWGKNVTPTSNLWPFAILYMALLSNSKGPYFNGSKQPQNQHQNERTRGLLGLLCISCGSISILQARISLFGSLMSLENVPNIRQHYKGIQQGTKVLLSLDIGLPHSQGESMAGLSIKNLVM